MSVLGTVRDLLAGTGRNPNRGGGEPVSEGAYWCNDCGVRVRDVDVDGDDEPTCPECGDAMAFERSAASTGCAC